MSKEKDRKELGEAERREQGEHLRERSEHLWFDVRCNLSAMLVLLVKQQAIIGKLLEELLKTGALRQISLERITSIAEDKNELSHVYAEVHKDFLKQFLRISKMLEDEELNGKVPKNGKD